MDLIERIKKIAEAEGIPESDLILDEARFFMRKHAGHGCYEMQIFYDENGSLYSIDLKCYATQIPVEEINKCDQDEFPTSVIYERERSFEGHTKAQRERRERILREKSKHYEK